MTMLLGMSPGHRSLLSGKGVTTDRKNSLGSLLWVSQALHMDVFSFCTLSVVHLCCYLLDIIIKTS